MPASARIDTRTRSAPGGHPRSDRPLARALAAVLAGSMLCVAAAAPPPAHAAAPAAEAGVDTAIHPGDDFFAYANGAWLAATEIPAGQDRVTARTEINAATRRQIDALLAATATAPTGSEARKIADFRAAYANEAAIEADGLAALEPLFERIEKLSDKPGLARLLGEEMRADVDPLNWGTYDSSHLLGLSVQPGLHGEPTNVAFLLQGGLGLPERAQYLGDSAAQQALRADYVAYIARLLALAGFDDATPRAAAVMALETALARSHATPEVSADNDRNVEHHWPRADFARQAPGMDWDAFFDAAGLARQEDFVVWQPCAIVGTASLVESEPLAAWRDYLRFHALHRHADVLPRAYAEAALALQGKATSDSSPPAPRAQRATQATEAALVGAIGRLYAERHFPPATKARVQTIVANVADAYARRVEASTWLSPASKRMALAKLDAMYFDVGYPAKWQDYTALRIEPEDAAGNLRRLAEWNYRNALARLGRPVDKTEWWIPPQMAGAVLLFQQNAYNFAAALLQPPKFDPDAPEAANYGAIGAIVGHETSHFIDTLGADYEASGRKTRWWTAGDLESYGQVTAPLIAQYAGYRPLRDAAVDGKLTLVENLADLGGLNAAFDAHRRALGDKADDAAYVRQQDRQFFIGYARSWRSELTPEALRKLVAGDSHAPDAYRIATVRNLDAWYEAFDVRPKHRLYLPPDERVRIW